MHFLQSHEHSLDDDMTRKRLCNDKIYLNATHVNPSFFIFLYTCSLFYIRNVVKQALLTIAEKLRLPASKGLKCNPNKITNRK